MAEGEIAETRSNTAVHHRGDATFDGELVEVEGILLEEGDVNDIDPGLDDLLERGVAHGPRHGADGEIVAGHHLCNRAGSPRSARRVVTRGNPANRSNASRDTSAAVISQPSSIAKSLTMAFPTRPHPRTTTFIPTSIAAADTVADQSLIAENGDGAPGAGAIAVFGESMPL